MGITLEDYQNMSYDLSEILRYSTELKAQVEGYKEMVHGHHQD